MAEICMAQPSDVDQLVCLENTLFTSDRISRRQFLYLISRGSALVYTLFVRNELNGYIILLTRKNSTKYRIYSIGVAQSAHGRGYGRKLLFFAEETAKHRGGSRLTLEVCECNVRAINLYQRSGFVVVGRKEHYYEDGCAAILMEKVLGRGDR